MAITLTQDTYRLWCRIGYVSGFTIADAQVALQLAQLDAQEIVMEQY